MDIKEIVNSKGSKGAAAAAAAVHGAGHDLHLLQTMSQATNFSMSDTGSNRSNSPHDSEHSRYSAPRLMNGMGGTPTDMRYPSPTAMQNPLPMLQQPYRPDNGYNGNMMQQNNGQIVGPNMHVLPDGTAPKAFPCSTCGKGFARRSDLARHGMLQIQTQSNDALTFSIERIHSGVRPHMCDHPGCGKQFIQRSALTVHQRVHTGEKPHMCERCSKVSTLSPNIENILIFQSLSVIQAPWLDIEEYTLANGLTNAPMQIVKRHSLAVLP